MSSVDLEKNQTEDVEFVNIANQVVEGLQFAVNFDDSKVKILEVKIGGELATESMFNLTGNTLKVVVDGNAAEKQLLTVTVMALEAINGNLFTLNDQVMSNVAYAQNTGEVSIELRNETSEVETIAVYNLEQNTPNPWMNTTNINFVSVSDGVGVLNVMDTNGKSVISRNLEIRRGDNNVKITSDELPASGIYYYEVSINNTRLMKKMILIK